MTVSKSVNSLHASVLVIGAGVLGLSTALHLQCILPHGTSITILASEFPQDREPTADYASAWAGAHYRPIPTSSPQLKSEMEWGWRTAEIMRDIADKYGVKTGVKTCKGMEYLEEMPEVVKGIKTGDVYAGVGDGFRVLEAKELPSDVAWGCEYEAYTINVPVYCTWLLEQFRAGGGKDIRCSLKNAADAFHVEKQAGQEEATVVVNCSGRNFDTDPAVKIIRGQTVLVRNPYHMTVTRQMKDGSWAFLIPRPFDGGTIVGGTKEIGDWTTEARLESRTKLLENAVKYFPEFIGHVDEFNVVKDNVGRRPWREGGMRMEIEMLEGGDTCIVHGYGAGGRGYELSWAIAEKLGDLVQQALLAVKS